MEKSLDTAEFRAQIAQRDKHILELENTVAELTALVKHFEELFVLSQRRRFGASSEKTDPQQLSIFPENPAPEKPSKTATEEITYKRTKRKGKRQEDLSKLPLEIVEHDIPENERFCPGCGETLTPIGTETRDEIKIVPPKVIPVQHRRKVYKCAKCAETAETTPIVKATMPEPVIKGSVASASAVAYIMTQKHLMHLPFYRLEQDFQRQGVFLNRQNMCNWSMQVCNDWLKPIYERLRTRLLAHDCLHGDETTLQVLKEPGKTPQQKSYMWLYRTSGESKTPVVYYEYQPSREGEHPEAFLKGWRGYLHTDGYSAYHGLDGVTAIGCWAHVRRKSGWITAPVYLRWKKHTPRCHPKNGWRRA
jgi:transposase